MFGFVDVGVLAIVYKLACGRPGFKTQILGFDRIFIIKTIYIFKKINIL
jgi:hypothetical protein